MQLFAAVLFDLDGTLIDSERWHHTSELETYAEFGFTPTDEEMRAGVGIPMRVTVERLAAQHGLSMTADSFRERHQPRLAKYVRERMDLFADVADTIASFSNHKLGLVTSSERWYVDEVALKFSEVFDLFTAHVCSDDVKDGKPSPAPYLLAAERLGIEASECLAIEDSHNGILSAVNAGCQTVVIVRNGESAGIPTGLRMVRSLQELKTE